MANSNSTYISYMLENNAGGLFSIDSNSGSLVLDGRRNYENDTSHQITVRATRTDGSTNTADFTVNVLDVNEYDITPIIDKNNLSNEISELNEKVDVFSETLGFGRDGGSNVALPS